MPYIGNEVGNRFVASKAASVYSGNGSTTAFTLEHAVGSDEDILVSVDGVVQEPSVAYAVSSGTTLTFTAAPSSNSGNNIFVYYLFRTVATVDHPSTSALTATSGTTVVLGTGATVSDIIEVIKYDAFSVADTVSAKDGGGFGGNISTSGTLAVTGTSTFTGAATFSADASVGDDLSLVSDGSIVNFGENSEISLTHVHNSGLTLASSVGATTFKIGRAGATDAKILFDGNAQDYHIGVDDTNDSLVIGLGNTLGTTDSMVIDSTGAVTKPLQPAFLSGTSRVTTITGDGTTYSATAATWTDIYDQNADFSNGTFTAPVTGKYNFTFLLTIAGTATNHTNSTFTLVASNRNTTYYNSPGVDRNTSLGGTSYVLTTNVDMDASDTMHLSLSVAGGDKTIMLYELSRFSGYLIA